MKPSLFDHLKVRAIIRTRYMNYAAIEKWSKKTLRRGRQNGSRPISEPARDHYGSPGIPARLRVPREIPRASRLPLLYKLPYYIATGLLFKLHLRWPIRRGVPWSPDLEFNDAFPKNKEGWTDVFEDRGFAQLRVQGPNPFLLRHDPGSDRYVVDYSPFFKSIFDPVVCVFRLDDRQLMPESITVGGERFEPGDDGWERAKLVANGLDARYCVFTRHLLDTHLLIGEAFALSAFALPSGHPLRPFLDLFTYNTLDVNDFAYKLLITPASYFLQSRFISGEDAMTLFRNSMDAFSLDDLIVPRDVARRGIDRIPDHPYVADGLAAWSVFQDFVGGHIDGLYADDEAIVGDADLQGWYGELAALLPNRDVTDDPLDGKKRLVNVLCCLLYNNVSHEVCGDYSPYLQSPDPEHKKIVNSERLKAGDQGTPADMADVFQLDQGAFAGRFNVGGNNMLTMKVDDVTGDPGLRAALRELQARLRELDERLERVNEKRRIPFLRMMPRKWETSISF